MEACTNTRIVLSIIIHVIEFISKFETVFITSFSGELSKVVLQIDREKA